MHFLSRLMVVLATCVALVAIYLRMGFTGGVMIMGTCGILVASAAVKLRNRFPHLTAETSVEVGQTTPLNESVFELYRPPGKPSMEVVFFHGFQDGDYLKAHVSTWQSRDGSVIWPQTWLVQEFPEARILSVSYKSSLSKGCEGGSTDMYIISENLISDLLAAKIGQAPCCPVVLVGHSFGGLVIKHVCVLASSKIGQVKRNSEQLTTFLGNVSGIFFYSTPHQGMHDRAAEYFLPQGPLLAYVKNLSPLLARDEWNFDNLCGQGGQYKMWQIAGLGEGRRTKQGTFSEVVVGEGSARYRSFNIVAEADHITICRPKEKTSRSFLTLVDFLKDVDKKAKAMVYGLPDYPTALERRAIEVRQILTSSPIVGIVGMGGIGKTTIARELFNNISSQFEYACFVDNVKGIRMHELKDWTLNQFLRNGNKVDQNSLQWSHLENKTTLITMDDVDSENQVRILPPLNKFGKGSRLIFTTRDGGVLRTTPKCAIYPVDLLNFVEAKSLFCHHAFEQEGIPDNLVEVNNHLEENVEKVVEKCDGLPLSLEVLGSYLRCDETNATVWDGHKTNPEVWVQALHMLSMAEPVNGVREDRLWRALRVSYGALSPKEQGMFIEAGIYFFGQPVERALAAWSTAYGDAEIRWANLLRTSMVKEAERFVWDEGWGKQITYKEVWVHEHLRDLANNISGGVMLFSSLETQFDTNEVGAETSILCLGSESNREEIEEKEELQFELELLDKFQNLKYLELFSVVPRGSSKNSLQKLSLLRWRLPSDYSKLLPFSLEHLRNLAVLDLENWEIQEEWLATLGSLRNLRILSLSWIKGLVRLPENFGCLPQLKRLKLQVMQLSALSQSFGSLSTLEHLVVSNSTELVELPESFGRLSALQKLSMWGCGLLQSLPDNFGQLLALQELNLEGCSQLQRLPDNFGQLLALQKLDLRHCKKLQRLPDNFGQLCGLQELNLLRCKQLERLPDNFGQLSSLQKLDMERCELLERLPESFGQLSALQELNLSECNQLQRLPDNFGHLSTLQELNLRRCDQLQRLPDSFGQLSALQELNISGCEQLERLPDNFGQLSALQELNISGCEQLERLPDNFGQLSALQKLDMKGCELLERLPDSFGQLSALQELNLSECKQLQRLPDSFGHLSALQELYLGGCEQLQRLPENFGQLSALQKLDLSLCEQLQSLPENFGQLSALQKLDLSLCEQLQSLPENFGQLSALQKLYLQGCEQLERFPDSFGQLSALQKLCLLGSARLQRLPDNFGQLSALRKLYFLECKQLQRLSDNFGRLCALQELDLWGCEQLQRLPDSFGQLSALQGLNLSECKQLQRLPENFGQLSALQELYLWRCEQLQSLPDSFGQLWALQKLDLSQCEQLQSLPENFGQLSALQKLYLQQCKQLQRLPDNFGRLSALQELDLEGCEHLEGLPDNFGQLLAL